MRTLKLSIVLLFVSILSYSQCVTQFFGAKYTQNKTISLNVSQLNPDYSYSGLQATMPLFDSKTFLANAEVGRGIVINKVGFIGYGVIGLYIYDFGDWKLNYGIGFQTFYKNVFVGVNCTNKEHLGIKLGICFNSMLCPIKYHK